MTGRTRRLDRAPRRRSRTAERGLRVENLEDRRLLAVQPFPTPLDPIDPAGSLIYETTSTAAIDTSGESETFTIALDGGQTLSVSVDPAAALDAEVAVLHPEGVTITSANAAGAGGIELINGVTVTEPGVYSVVVTGAGGSTGAFDVRAVLNGLIEVESLTGAPNGAAGVAESLAGGFVPLTPLGGERGAVVGDLEAGLSLVVDADDFESGALDGSWSTSSSAPEGRIRVTGASGTAGGAFALLMDRDPDGGDVLNEAIWTVDLTGLDAATLSFSFTEFSDETTSLPLDFVGSANGDGVAISDDGVTWRTVLNAPDTADGVWEQVAFDLAAEAAAAGMTLGPGFQIKFQQFDNFPIPTDGRGYDEISITTSLPTADWYEFSLADGQSASLAVTVDGSGSPLVDLYASDGVTLLASSVGAANVDAAIDGFVDPTSDGFLDAYFARVSGGVGPYSLVVTRDAHFDTEPNNDFTGAQPLDASGVVLGHVTGDPLSAALGLATGGAAVAGPAAPNVDAPREASIPLPSTTGLPFEQIHAQLLQGQSPYAPVGGGGEEGTAQGAGALAGPIPVLQQFAGPGSNGFIPADPIAAAGPEQVVAMVNTSIGIYDKETGAELFSQNLNNAGGFFGSVGANAVVFDPWILYDPDTERFFAIAIDIETDTLSHLYVAVSTDSTPTDGDDWHKYKLPFTHLPDASLGTGAHFADYPKLGVNDDAIWVSGNYFPIDAGTGVYAGITAFEKAPLLSGGPLNQLYQEFFSGFSVFPMTQYDSGSTQYFAESFTGGGSTIRVHQVSDVLASPTRTVTTVTAPSYQFPDDVPQLGGGVGADSIDARVMTGVLRDGSMWFAHAADDPAIGDDEAVVRWYEIDISGPTPTLAQSGNVDPGPGVHAWMPAVAVDGAGNLGIGFSLGGPNRFLGAGFTGRLAGDPAGETVLPVTEYVTGTVNYQSLDSGGRNRWGDYTGLSIDPADDATFWVYNKYPANSNTWASEFASFQLQEPSDNDWYAFEAEVGDSLTILATAFAGGALQFENDLDIGLELFDPAGAPVALSTGPDGAGATINRSVAAGEGGAWRVRVFGENATEGEYVLRVLGATGVAPGPAVIDVDPDDGAVAPDFPTSITLDFSNPLLATTVEPADVTIGGFAAQSVVAIDGDTYEFVIDPAAFAGDGVYPIQLAAGAVTDLQGFGNTAFLGSFELDTTGPIIVGIDWNGGAFPPAFDEGPLSFEATFNEDLFQLGSARRGPFAPAGDDVTLLDLITGEEIDADAFAYDPNTDIFSADYDFLPEGAYRLSLFSGDGGFEDVVGNDLDGEPLGPGADGVPTGNGLAGGNYTIDFVVDRQSPTPINPLERLNPLGGLVFRSLGSGGLLSGASDVDEFVFDADATETLSLVLRPDDPTATLQVQINGGPPTIATAPGAAVLLDSAALGASGTQVLAIAGDLPTGFTFDVILNATAAAVVGDSSEGAPTDVDGSFLPLGSGRSAAVGLSSPRAINAAANRLFATPDDGSNQIVELSPVDGSELNRFAAPTAFSAANGLAYDGASLFFQAGSSATIYELDPDTGAVLDSDLIVGSGSYGGLAALDGNVYVVESGTANILVFNPRSDTVTAVLDVAGVNAGEIPLGGIAGVSGPNALVAAVDTGEIVEIDPTSGLITSRFTPVGASLDAGAAVIGGQIYVAASAGAPDVAVYDRSGVLDRTITLPYLVSALGGDEGQRQVGLLTDEPNDTLFDPVFADIGPNVGSYAGTGAVGDNPNVAAGLDVDLVEIRLDTGDLVQVDVDASLGGSTLDAVVTLFDAGGSVVAQADDALSTDAQLSFTALADGVYFVGVSGAGNTAYDPTTAGSGAAGSTGDYGLSIAIRIPSVDPLDEPNDTISDPVLTGIGPVSGSYAASGEIGDNPGVAAGLDVDLFEVELAALDQVVIDIDAADVGSSLDPILTLFDSTGVIVAQNDDFGSLDSFIDTTVVSAGLYYVGVSGFSNFNYDPFVEGSGAAGSTGVYDLTIDINPAPSANATGAATELITNGDFETGDFTGWTVVSGGSSQWVINDGSIAPLSGRGALPPISGGFDALIDVGAAAVNSLSQAFVVPTGIGSAVLNWSDRVHNLHTAFEDPLQEYRVYLADASGAFIQEVFSTDPGDALIQVGPNARSADLTTALQALEGQTVRLVFEEQDNFFFFNVALDDISLTVDSGLLLPDADAYAFTAQAGTSYDIVLSGLAGADFSGETLRVFDPSGALVATGAPDPLGVTAGSFDLGVLDLVAATSGVYEVRIASLVDGEYSLIVTESLLFDTEPNGPFAATLRQLTNDTPAVGYIDFGTSGGADAYEITVALGDPVSLVASAPPPTAARPSANPLEIDLIVTAPGGGVVATDTAVLENGDASVQFTAGAPGVYTVRLAAVAGAGEYLVEATVGVPAIPGDFDSDGDVDFDDFGVFILGFQNSPSGGPPFDPADFDEDGDVDVDDFGVFVNSFQLFGPPTSQSQLLGSGGAGESVAAAPVNLVGPIEAAAPVGYGSPAQSATAGNAQSSLLDPSARDESLLLLTLNDSGSAPEEDPTADESSPERSAVESAPGYDLSLDEAFAGLDPM